MEGILDYKDITNSLFLAQPCNREVATTYAHMKILEMAVMFPEIEGYSLSSELIEMCLKGSYDPLELIEYFEGLVEETRVVILNKYSCGSLKDIRAKLEDRASSKYSMMDSSEEILSSLHQITQLQEIYTEITRCGASLREDYAQIVSATKNIANKKKLFPLEALLESELRDQIITQAFPDKGFAEAHLGSLFFNYRILKILRPIGQYVASDTEIWKEFMETLSSLQIDEIDMLLSMNNQFAARERARLYGG